MNDLQKTSSNLGLAKKAGKAICGTEQICDTLKNKRKAVVAVFMANNVSENTKKRLSDRCAFYECPIHLLDMDTVSLGKCLGKASAVAAVAISDENFVKLILK